MNAIRTSCVLAAIAASGLFALPSISLAAPLPCTNTLSSFDGTEPIQYVTVTGTEGEKLYIHSQFPAECAVGGAKECKADAYLITGDQLATTNACDRWVYAQYIGERHVTVGWVEADRLQIVTSPDARGEHASSNVSNGKRYKFKIQRGNGVPVCEAYLQRLNQTDFPAPPYCGRPESDLVPGFALLKRTYLGDDAKVSMSGELFRLWTRPNPNLTGDWRWPARDISAWRYESPVDIGNDKRPKDLLVWNGAGLSGGDIRCGATWNNESWGFRPRQLPLVLVADGKADAIRNIDQSSTREIFQGQGKPNWEKARLCKSGRWIPIPAGWKIYRDIRIQKSGVLRHFFDLSGDWNGDRIGQPALANTLAVFSRTNRATHAICEYQLLRKDYPTSDDGE